MRQIHTGDPLSAQLQAARAIAHHGPDGAGPRHGSALCLSGGGFRAALFHLGAVRRLDELGVLGRLRTISAVSGGAIVANLLADARLDWPDPTGPPGRVGGFEEYVAEPLRALTARNVRTPAMLTRVRRPGRPDTMVAALAEQFRAVVPWWGQDLCCTERAGPAILTGATEVGYGVGWLFADPRSVPPYGLVGDHRLGYAAPPPGLRVTDAVAASCAYPPFFEPLELDGDVLGLVGGVPDADEEPQVTEELRRRVLLADGGVFDNLAVESVWSDHATLFVSDGGAVFRGRSAGSMLGRWWHLLSVSASGGQTTRLRWLRSAFSRGLLQGATWSLESPNTVSSVPGHAPARHERYGYPPGVVALLNRVRTDLDAFDPAEQMVLERHGYLVTDDSVYRHAPQVVARDVPFRPPHDRVGDPDWAAALLVGSARVRAWGRGASGL